MKSFPYINAVKTLALLLFIGVAGSHASSADPKGESEESCAITDTKLPGLDWMDKLNRSIGENVVVEDPEPGSSYDLKEPMLSKLVGAVHREAARPRRKGNGGRWIRDPARGKGWCYRAVKDALAAAGLVTKWWQESPARLAHQSGALTARGFTDIMANPGGFTSVNAPIGSILVYAGGPKGAGHIEIRTHRYEYCSDYCAALPLDVKTARKSTRRKLIGVYVKTNFDL